MARKPDLPLEPNDSHPEPWSGKTHGNDPGILMQGSSGTLSSQLYSDYDRSNVRDLDDQFGCYDEE